MILIYITLNNDFEAREIGKNILRELKKLSKTQLTTLIASPKFRSGGKGKNF